MDPRYALDAVRRNWNRPHWWATVFNSQVVGRVHGVLRDWDGVRVIDEDWDNLVILDACRYDLFEEVIADRDGPEGTLERRRSLGSGSPEFLRRNFAGRDCSDTVYVTANPFVSKVLEEPFYRVDHVWRDGWDDDEETVLPETMSERAVVAAERNPKKRLIVHFMQPHHPFVGDTRLEDDPGYVGARAKSTGEDVPDVKFVWEQLREGTVDRETVWRAYRANLERALDVVEGLLDDLEGKTVLTADHGNAFGERATPFPTRVYGHGDRIRIPALVDVPWFVVPSDERRSVTFGQATESEFTSRTDTDVEDRLAALGYR